MIPYSLLQAEAAAHPYPLLFATISGAHLYGFPSPDSDFDLRGAHILPARELLGLYPVKDTLTLEAFRGPIELDLVTHDIAKFFTLLLKPNGYVQEQLHSPLIVHTTPEHAELREIAKTCLTRFHHHHYLGFAATQWGLFQKETPPRVKPLLYTYRVLLTGIHLMRTGHIEANLVTLNEEFRLPYLPDLITRKLEGKEKTTLEAPELALHQSEYHRLVQTLEQAGAESHLPTEPSAKPALNDLLLRLRLR
jgi:predicted nucleotidyltransferase